MRSGTSPRPRPPCRSRRSPPAIPTRSWYWPIRRARPCRRTPRVRSGVRSARCASGVSSSSPAPCSGGRACAPRRPWRSCGGDSRRCHDPVARPRPRRRSRLRAGGGARARPRPARPAGVVRHRAVAAAAARRARPPRGRRARPGGREPAGARPQSARRPVPARPLGRRRARRGARDRLARPGLPVAVLLAAARPLDLLALGEEPARHLGADVEPLKRRVYLAASLLTAAAVAVSGVIGFVGLIVPHAMRLLWGHRHRSLLPASFLAGGTLLALADTAARVAVAPRELPVGIVTALVGVPLFALMLRRWTAS